MRENFNFVFWVVRVDNRYEETIEPQFFPKHSNSRSDEDTLKSET